MSTVQEFVESLRGRLAPKGVTPEGQEPIVKLTLRNHGYVDHAMVAASIDQLEKMMLFPGILGEASPLEKLGILLLTESVG